MGVRTPGNSFQAKAGKILSEKARIPQDSSRAMKRLIHKLRVHQIELEMPNEELRKMKEEIETSRRRCVDLYELAPVGCFTLDKKGIIMEVNLTGARLLGVEKGWLLETPFSLFVAPEDQDRFQDCWRNVLGEPGIQSCEMRLKRKANSSLWVDLESVAVKGPEGEITGGRLVLSDITERKRSDEALRASEERFQDLSSKLLSLHEMERKVLANEIHDEFLSDLAAVYYSLEANIKTLSKESHPLVPELQDRSKILQRAIKEAQRIMNRLRPTILDEVGLIPALTGFCREFKELYPHIQVECKLEVQENEIPDPIKVVIFRVAQEAMTNSARYGGADGSVKVSLTRSLDRIEFLAQDNGPGFDLGSVKKGVGLESMRERVEMSGGEFQLESAIGQGTKIRATWGLS